MEDPVRIAIQQRKHTGLKSDRNYMPITTGICGYGLAVTALVFQNYP